MRIYENSFVFLGKHWQRKHPTTETGIRDHERTQTQIQQNVGDKSPGEPDPHPRTGGSREHRVV